jgi:selenide,water dikinase
MACTDVTGFGLAGHLLEMLDASKVSARLSEREVRLYPGFAEVVAQGIVSTLHRDNAKMSYRVQGVESLPAWLFDPQTSGGLMAAVRPEAAARVLEELQHAGYAEAVIIGEVVASAAGEAPGIRLS